MDRSALAILLTGVAFAAGCDDDRDRAPKPPPEPERRGVVLFLDSANASPGDTLTLTVENHTRTRLEYGLIYRLERRVGGRWRWVNRNAAFVLLLKVVEPGRREREQIRLRDGLKPGHYRIVKSFMAPATNRRLNATIELQVR